ncbi:MAG: lysophospholipid transporter LplT [Methylicorpusculum sp.]|uniref:lysophospholipid transporter LplT n=1 Tax=Methylicorpusculum sp. TaxID=2713644 RepID=UPI00271CC1CB|nr:lysophospholipid transporter LplT [Methylicorpusculum sp.]MDO8940260.1 lysophospholipid transporter LplT [Methylicorpusculum sp.]MDP2200784.1 lysophospholipid transporter LplT [Methylicorpusculum sp.]
MHKQIYPLLIAQFLSAFADNAILFTVIAMAMHSTQLPSWYVPALQSVFIVAFVVLAPWVGNFADTHPKSRVLIIANLIKAAGAGLLLFNFEPLIAYCVIGAGAAIYSPAKYGILPELAGHAQLVKANSWIEGSTILAILTGMIVGAKVADFSTIWALSGTIALFVTSALVTLWLPVTTAHPKIPGSKIVLFSKQIITFFDTPRSRFAILGASMFWAAAATLRVILVAWAPLVLLSKNATEIAELTLFLAIGIVAGSALVPRMIPLEHLRRARIPAYLMALFILGLSFMDGIWESRAFLFLIGMSGGMFIVPINAALQEMGQQSIGSGSAVALQGFFQNAAMLLAVGGYTYAASLNVSPVLAMAWLGVLVFIVTFLVSIRLPEKN